MKKVMIAFLMLTAVPALAQDKFVPVIKQGTTLRYTASVNGENYACTFSLDSVTADFVKINWNVDQLGSGTWIMKSKSLQLGSRRYSGQPTPGVTEEMPDDQTVLILSKAQWASLQKDKKVTFDNQAFTVKMPTSQQQITLAGKGLDVFLLENANATTHIWVLNNAAFPILLKTEGNNGAADLTITAVE